jgi:tetratricopeptide (TPR) repeat protein
MTRRLVQSLVALAVGFSPLGAPGRLVAGGLTVEQQLKFAADMAVEGNWREAQYRWRQVVDAVPDKAGILNNLAVAAEAAGRFDEAFALYERALAASGGDERIRLNQIRARELYEDIRPAGDANPPAGEPKSAPAAPAPASGSSKGGKPIEVRIAVPVSAPLEVGDRQSALVASFLANESAFLDINRELVRLLRGEIRKRTRLEVIDAVPPPAVPEQRLDDLALNAEFWRHLGREYSADLIVSGAVAYTRREVSGFRDVDLVDPTTGQKVRQTRFVEEEEFSYVVDVLYLDGKTGELLSRAA